jgi:hypothetical protein
LHSIIKLVLAQGSAAKGPLSLDVSQWPEVSQYLKLPTSTRSKRGDPMVFPLVDTQILYVAQSLGSPTFPSQELNSNPEVREEVLSYFLNA